ncbi:MAG: D-amino-acid transaminase [Chromatiales bacterium]|jgi:D-alanine transaminase|nr:D-amino-acid transaminase [Chromatiales bacterium]
MARICYVNGAFVEEADAKVSIFDRGFLFADGVYEVSSILGGKLVDNAAHLRRLERSLGELGITSPVPLADIAGIQDELIARNGMDEGVVYLQITRGAADRDFNFPATATPTLVMFTQTRAIIDSPKAQSGIRVITVPDIRWKRRDIKTVGLLGSALAKETARSQGADDAWMVEDGFITEGSSNNAYIVNEDGLIITRNLGSEILSGVTRLAVLALCERDDLEVEERPFTVEEALRAKEAFSTSASTFVLSVVNIDGKPIGDGKPGPVATRLRNVYIQAALANTT